MKRFYCNGKKGYCEKRTRCFEDDCPYFDGSGGEEVEVPEGATRWWYFCSCLKKRLKSLCCRARRK